MLIKEDGTVIFAPGTFERHKRMFIDIAFADAATVASRARAGAYLEMHQELLSLAEKPENWSCTEVLRRVALEVCERAGVELDGEPRPQVAAAGTPLNGD